MYEVWWEHGRTRKVVARFRLLKDAEKYVAKHIDDPGSFELIEADPYGDGPVSQDHPAAGAPTSERPRRRWSGVMGRQVAAEHPDEFIADRVDSQRDKAGNGDHD